MRDRNRLLRDGIRDARWFDALEARMAEAGAAMLVLELMPSSVAAEITAALPIPTIGIGAGAQCSGQVLVLHDMLGITAAYGGRLPRFVRNFGAEATAAASEGRGGSIEQSIRRYVAAVRDGSFPDATLHSY